MSLKNKKKQKTSWWRLTRRAAVPALVIAVFAIGALRHIFQAEGAGWYDAAWENRQLITINSSITDSDLTGFPVLVAVTTTNPIFGTAHGTGTDILFTDSDGTTLLDYEIERYDDAVNELFAWVQVPTLSSSVNTEVYMYYNNSALDHRATSTGVWDGYEMVYHFTEFPATGATYTMREGEDGYTGMIDVSILSGAPTTNQNSETSLRVDGVSCGGGICRALMKWDISSMGSCTTVDSALITINGTNASADIYHVYGLRRDWVETQATWNIYSTSNSWTTAGATDTTNDRFSTDLMNGNSNGGFGNNSTGALSYDFDADGISLIQDWVDGVTSNFGVIIYNESGDDDSFQWSTSENATVGNRPLLSITCDTTAGDDYNDRTTQAHDVNDQAVTGTTTSPVWRGPEFNGSTSNYLVIPNSGWTSSNWTLEAIFYRRASGVTMTCGTGCTTDAYPIITKGRGEGDGGGVDTQFQLGTSNADDFAAISFEEPTAGSGFTDKNATASSDDTWYYAAARMDDSANELESFINDQTNGATTVTATVPTAQGNPVCIGAACNSNGSAGILGSWDGYIDEVRISHVARSADWIEASYRTIFGGRTYLQFGDEESAVSISSAANQIFYVNASATANSTITVTDSATPTITTTNDLRVRIPSSLDMVWANDTSATFGGTASGKVGTITYEDSFKTLVIAVTENFANSDTLTIANLTFENFGSISSTDNLELVTAGSGGATAAEDDKTIQIDAEVVPVQDSIRIKGGLRFFGGVRFK